MPALKADIVFGPYHLLRLLARGGMGDVWLACTPNQPDRRGDVVVKVLKEEFAANKAMRSMFLHEARLGSHLVHPRIAQICDFGECEGTLYLAMEYVPGPALSSLVHRLRWEVPLGAALQIVADVAAALQYAHTAKGPDGAELRVVHRDVTPQNILVSEKGYVKLIDFGVAKSSAQDYQTRTGVLKGKLAYMAPEQFEGKVTAQTDIFALGIILHELVSHERLFKRPTEAQTFAAVLSETIAPVKAEAHVLARVQPIVSKALARDPAERYLSAAELETDVRRAMGELAVTAEPDELAALVASVKKKQRAIAAVEAEKTTSDSGFRLRSTGDGFEELAAADPFLADIEPLTGELTISDQRELPGLRPVAVLSASESTHQLPQGASKKRTAFKVAAGAAALGALGAIVLLIVATFVDRSAPEIQTTQLPSTAAADATQAPGEPAPSVVEPAGSVVEAAPVVEAPPVGAPEPPAPGEAAEPADAVVVAATPRRRRRRVRRPATPSPAPAVETGTGRLFLNTVPWSTVRIGPRNLGQTPIVNAEVPAGRSVLIIREGNGDVHRVPIRIRANRATKRTIQLHR